MRPVVSALSTCVIMLALGCRPSPSAEVRGFEPVTVERAPTIAFERTRLHEAILLDDAILLIGQRRPPADTYVSEAWIARVDLDGRVEWEVSVGDRFSWAETALVDPHGSIHVFGRDAGRQAWLLSLDSHGVQTGFERIAGDDRVGFAITAMQVQLFVYATTDDWNERPAVWLRRSWRDPGAAPTRELVDLDGAPQVVPLGPDIFELDDDEFVRAEPSTGSEPRSVERLDSDEADAALAGLDPAPAQPVAVELPIGLAAPLDFGATAVVLIQLPPHGEVDASLRMLRATPAELAQLPTRLERAAADLEPATLADPLGDLGWSWMWPFLPEPGVIAPAARSRLGQWLLEGGECSVVREELICSDERVSYPIPSAYDPGDPCWRLAQIEAFVDSSDRASLVANLPALLELILASHLDGRWLDTVELRDWTTADTIVAKAIELGLGAAVVRALVLDTEPDSDVAFRGIEALEELPTAEAVELARALIADLRDDSRRCEEVMQLAAFLRTRSAPVPRWTTDLDSDCDILYSLCTGLDPRLEDRIVGPRGYEIIETCAPGLLLDPELAAEHGLPVCVPDHRRSQELEREIEPVEAFDCGSNERLTELHYSCGVSSEFELTHYTFDCATKPCVLERLEILHTTVE